MTKLHGKEIKVGDKVWSFVRNEGWTFVTHIMPYDIYPIKTPMNSYMEDGRIHRDDDLCVLHWQEMEIVPKPELIYEYQFLYSQESNEGKFSATNGFYQTAEECKAWLALPARKIIRIEESKREVK